MQPENPYEPGYSLTDSANPVSQFLFQVGQWLLKIVVASLFTCVVAGAIWLFYNGYAWAVSIATLAMTAAAAFLGGTTRREGIIWSLSTPMLAFGGFIGFQLFFVLATFDWFLRLVSDDVLGRLVFIAFVFGFAGAAFAGACWGFSRLLPK